LKLLFQTTPPKKQSSSKKKNKSEPSKDGRNDQQDVKSTLYGGLANLDININIKALKDRLRKMPIAHCDSLDYVPVEDNKRRPS
jgi:hypothetical protein